MFTISTLSFAQLKNAEYVAFFNNVVLKLKKKTAEIWSTLHCPNKPTQQLPANNS